MSAGNVQFTTMLRAQMKTSKFSTVSEINRIQEDFLFKKCAVAYMKKEFQGFMGPGLSKEDFLQVKFHLSGGDAYKLLGKLCAKDFVSFA